MKDTYFFPPDNKLERLATAYTYYPDKGLNRFPDTPIKEGIFVVLRRLSFAWTEEILLGRRWPGFDRHGLRSLLPDDARRRQESVTRACLSRKVR